MVSVILDPLTQISMNLWGLSCSKSFSLYKPLVAVSVFVVTNCVHYFR